MAVSLLRRRMIEDMQVRNLAGDAMLLRACRGEVRSVAELVRTEPRRRMDV